MEVTPIPSPIPAAPKTKRARKVLSPHDKALKDLKALVKSFIGDPTRPERLTALVGGLVDWELRARLKAPS